MSKPTRRVTVGVIIPFYQRDLGILRRSLDSIAAQDLPADVEMRIVVVDDASPLPADEALEGFEPAPPHRLDIVRQPNGGPGAARNGGIDHLADQDVDYLAFLDSDDTWSKDHLRQALDALSSGADFYFANSAFNAGDSFGHWTYFQRRHGGPGGYSPTEGELTSVQALDVIADECLPHASQVVYDFRRHADARFDVSFRRACEDQLFFLALGRRASRIVYSTQLMGSRGKGVSIYDATLAWDSVNAPDRVIEELRYRKTLLGLTDFGSRKKVRIFFSARQKVDHLVFLTLRNLRRNPPVAKAAIRRFFRETPAFAVFLPVSILTLPLHYLKLRADARALQEAPAPA